VIALNRRAARLGLAVLAIPVVGAGLNGLLPPLLFVRRHVVAWPRYRPAGRSGQRIVAGCRSHAFACC